MALPLELKTLNLDLQPDLAYIHPCKPPLGSSWRSCFARMDKASASACICSGFWRAWGSGSPEVCMQGLGSSSPTAATARCKVLLFTEPLG